LSTFSENINYLRKAKGLNQSDMPDILGIQRSTWANYENGATEPPIETIIKISRYFGISLDDLMLKKLDSDKYQSIVDEGTPPYEELQGLKSRALKKNNPKSVKTKNSKKENNLELETWTILGQLKIMDEKLESIISRLENKMDKK
jgi:transcriptional regulator with XRE-family HTH domain